jgi:hypothetical protein
MPKEAVVAYLMPTGTEKYHENLSQDRRSQAGLRPKLRASRTRFKSSDHFIALRDSDLSAGAISQGGVGQVAGRCPRPLVTRPCKLFVNLLLVTLSSFSLFLPKVSRNIVILICLLHTNAAQATEFKPTVNANSQLNTVR